MRIVGILVLLLGVGLAGGALVYANKIFEQFEAQSRAPVQQIATVPIMVASQQIKYGERVEEDLVRIIDWPAASVPPGAFSSPEDLFGDATTERRVALREIEQGEPILESKVTGFGEDSRVAMRLGEGKRAFSLQIDAVSGVAGFVAPGDRVDIILTESRGVQLSSRVILQDIMVIAVDQRSQTNSISPQVGRTATVEVDSRQAQKLALAQQIGRISLTLRGVNDVPTTDETELAPVSVDELMNRELEVAAEPDRGTTVRVRRGGANVEELRVD